MLLLSAYLHNKYQQITTLLESAKIGGLIKNFTTRFTTKLLNYFNFN